MTIELTTKLVNDATTALYCGRCRVGYVDHRGRAQRGADDAYRWSLNFQSERLRHCPTGVTATHDEAVVAATYAFRAWCAAANLVEKCK